MHSSMSAEQEAVVMIGMGCRLPRDVNGPDDISKLLYQGVDAIAEPPTAVGIRADTGT